MKEEHIPILSTLKEKLEEISTPLEAAQSEFYGHDPEEIRPGLDLIMNELTMVVLLLTGTDSEVADRELELLNDMRHVAYGYGIPELTSNDYMELCREFLRLYPNGLITIDHLPFSVKLLRSYDQAHQTEYANKARTIFMEFAEALVNADHEEHPVEAILLANFKETLNAVS